MTKMEMINAILREVKDTLLNVKINVNKQNKEWVERAYNFVMNSETETEKIKNAKFVIQFLR